MFLFESNGREPRRWLGRLQGRRTIPSQAGSCLRDQDQARPGQDEEGHPRKLQVAVTLFRDELTGFLRADNFNECLYAFNIGADQVSLTTDTPSIDKYKRKSTISSIQAISS